MGQNITPRDVEFSLADDEFIVSKTDISGRIKYMNRVFMHISGFSESELLGQHHNMIRHPNMPRGVFKLLWETIKSGKEFFGYVKNICKDGSFYWVYANITCDYDERGNLRGYYSVRRKPSQLAVETFTSLYAQMLTIEKQAGDKQAADLSLKFLTEHIKAHNASYTAFVQNLDKELVT